MSYPKEKQREYQRLWMANRRADWISTNGPCQHCGSNDNLEVDHIDPSTKEFSPSQIWSRCEEVREAELAKCQVLCYDCHKIKTFTKDIKRAGHGSNKLYDRGCRCDLCREAKRIKNAKRYK